MAKRKQNINQIAQWPKRIWQFALEARDELKKVSWPTRQTTVRYTTIVIIASLIVGAVIGGIDYLFAIALEQVV